MNIDLSKITRLEVINHSNINDEKGRIVVAYKGEKGFDDIDIQVQDNGTTVKIFLSSKEHK